jgi:hypothetical protein
LVSSHYRHLSWSFWILLGMGIYCLASWRIHSPDTVPCSKPSHPIKLLSAGNLDSWSRWLHSVSIRQSPERRRASHERQLQVVGFSSWTCQSQVQNKWWDRA